MPQGPPQGKEWFMNDAPPERAQSKARKERLARALRDNLKRRKGQAKARAEQRPDTSKPGPNRPKT